MSTTTVWESGLTCDAADCGGEFVLGEEIIYWYGRKLHQRCAAQDAASRRDAVASEDILTVAREFLAAGSRVIMNRRQIRGLVTLACAAGVEPVRKPDAGRQQWYGRMHGWSAERVRGGLNADEVAGMWLDFLDAGRMPPLRQADLFVLVEVISPVTEALS